MSVVMVAAVVVVDVIAAVDVVAEDILTKTPKPFDMEEAEVRYPVLFEESMNTVLCQELVKVRCSLHFFSSNLLL